MKYIIGKEGEVVIFSVKFMHSDVAKQMGLVPVSAGFVNGFGQIAVAGESTSLGLASRAEDIEKIEMELMI